MCMGVQVSGKPDISDFLELYLRGMLGANSDLWNNNNTLITTETPL